MVPLLIAFLGGATAYLVGWLETDNRAISVQLNLTGTATGTELGKIYYIHLWNLDFIKEKLCP